MKRAAKCAGFLAALALAGFCVAAAPRQWKVAVETLRFGRRHIGDSLPVARREIYGARFMEGIDAIAAVIPPDGSYWLVDGNENPAHGFFVRSALAPRKARYLGRMGAIDAGQVRLVLAARPIPFVVLAWQPDGPPALVHPHSFLRGPAAP